MSPIPSAVLYAHVRPLRAVSRFVRRMRACSRNAILAKINVIVKDFRITFVGIAFYALYLHRIAERTSTLYVYFFLCLNVEKNSKQPAAVFLILDTWSNAGVRQVRLTSETW